MATSHLKSRISIPFREVYIKKQQSFTPRFTDRPPDKKRQTGRRFSLSIQIIQNHHKKNILHTHSFHITNLLNSIYPLLVRTERATYTTNT